ncbi:hypothetical protein PYCCODRAFT_412553 [Trametes coccinea BRFM310]|uniref:Uncharacterized protein n=1 Tax=Trametes coccinea (strain BRFM310) TaxID=1353009 RepID=A0A1Y2IM80_TRAC3|nr:hypothetical protein PYCCODRAFT_412553 [Trametes coccinea BRFM310]
MNTQFSPRRYNAFCPRGSRHVPCSAQVQAAIPCYLTYLSFCRCTRRAAWYVCGVVMRVCCWPWMVSLAGTGCIPIMTMLRF